MSTDQQVSGTHRPSSFTVLDRLRHGLAAVLSDLQLLPTDNRYFYVLAWFCRATNGFHNVAASTWHWSRIAENGQALAALSRAAKDDTRLAEIDKSAQLLGFEASASTACLRNLTSNVERLVAIKNYFGMYPQDPTTGLCGTARSTWLGSGSSVLKWERESEPDSEKLAALEAATGTERLFNEIWGVVRDASGTGPGGDFTVVPLVHFGLFLGVLGMWIPRSVNVSNEAADGQAELLSKLSEKQGELALFLHGLSHEVGEDRIKISHEDDALTDLKADDAHRNRFLRHWPYYAPAARRCELKQLSTANGEVLVVGRKQARSFVPEGEFAFEIDAPNDNTQRRLTELMTRDGFAACWAHSRTSAKPEPGSIDSTSYDVLHRFVAPSDAPVLILGGTGTGKEFVARSLHNWRSLPNPDDRHKRGEFVVVNCAGLEPNLARAELVGHVARAYTDGKTAKLGAILLASGATPRGSADPRSNPDMTGHWRSFAGLCSKKRDENSKEASKAADWYELDGGVPGTLFLDEIADLPMEAQGALLRVLDGYGFVPIGWGEPHKPIVPKFRLIAATYNERKLHDPRKFREDLLARLSTWRVRTVKHISEALALALRVADLRAKEIAPGGALGASGEIEIAQMVREGRFDGPEGGNLRGIKAAIDRAVAFAVAEAKEDGRAAAVEIAGEHILWACHERWMWGARESAPEGAAQRPSSDISELGAPKRASKQLESRKPLVSSDELEPRSRVVLECAAAIDAALGQSLAGLRENGWDRWLKSCRPYTARKEVLRKGDEAHIKLYRALLFKFYDLGWHVQDLQKAYDAKSRMELAWRKAENAANPDALLPEFRATAGTKKGSS